MIAAADFQNAWPTPVPHTLTVHHGPETPSSITFPLGACERSHSRTTEFLPSDFAPLPPDQIPTPDYTVTRDLIRNAVAVAIRTQSGVGINTSRFTVAIDNPADAEVCAQYEYPLRAGGMEILIRSECITRSDAKLFHHTTDVAVTIDGTPHWSRKWSVTVPREGC
jgi:hypothetical protein